MPDTDAHVHLRLDPSDKREWERYADEHIDYASLAHMIRVAVWNEINDERDVQVDLAPITDTLDSLGERLDEMSEAVDRIDLAAENSRQIQTLAEEILPQLPQRDGGADEEGDWLGTDPDPDMDPKDAAADFGRLDDLVALHPDQEPYSVRRACEKLAHDLDWVHTATDHTDTPRYWRTADA